MKATLFGDHKGLFLKVEVSANTEVRFRLVLAGLQKRTTDHLVTTGELLGEIIDRKKEKFKKRSMIGEVVLSARDVRKFIRIQERKLGLMGSGQVSIKTG